MLIVKCSWCDREISRNHKKNGITHGICVPCFDKTMRDVRRILPWKTSLLKKTVLGENTLAEHY